MFNPDYSNEFSVYKRGKNLHKTEGLQSMENAALAQTCLLPKTKSAEYGECCTCTNLFCCGLLSSESAALKQTLINDCDLFRQNLVVPTTSTHYISYWAGHICLFWL